MLASEPRADKAPLRALSASLAPIELARTLPALRAPPAAIAGLHIEDLRSVEWGRA